MLKQGAITLFAFPSSYESQLSNKQHELVLVKSSVSCIIVVAQYYKRLHLRENFLYIIPCIAKVFEKCHKLFYEECGVEIKVKQQLLFTQKTSLVISRSYSFVALNTPLSPLHARTYNMCSSHVR